MVRSYQTSPYLLPLAFSVVLSLVSQVWGSLPGQVAAVRVTEASYRHYLDDMLYTHAGDDRGLYGADHDAARDNIVMLFESYGLDVALHPFEFNGDSFYNVVATMPGTTYPDREYIVGAHFDSGDPFPDGGTPGADDNASGVALVLEAARVLSKYESDCTIRFIAFDAEEYGLVGSYAYVSDHLSDDIRGMIAADMVAYNRGQDAIRIYGGTPSEPVKDALAAAVDTYTYGLTVQVLTDSQASDHWPFEVAGFQACHLIEWYGNPYMHTPQDNVDMPDYIDYNYATQITRGVVGFLVDHAGVQVLIPDADFDGDGDVDGDDFAQFELCFAGSGSPVDPPCNFFDLEADGDVDCVDWRIFEALWTGPPSDPPVFVLCNALPPDLLGVGNRCIVLDLDPLGSSTPLAIYVTGAADEPAVECISRYVQANNHLGSSPVYQSPEDWGTVVVCDAQIIPGTSYYIQSDYGQPGSPLLSPTSRVTTFLWGDTVGDFVNGQWTPPDGDVDFVDIASVVDAFKNLPTAPAKYRVELVGPSGSECIPDMNIDFLDISAAVEAFKGYDFWETTSCPPPCE